MAKIVTTIKRLVLLDNGQDLLEYGFLAALIAIVAMVGITAVGNTLYTVFWSGIGSAV
jgi:Flp pilus assembly pilin Flp